MFSEEQLIKQAEENDHLFKMKNERDTYKRAFFALLILIGIVILVQFSK
jgi:hypothetical protein